MDHSDGETRTLSAKASCFDLTESGLTNSLQRFDN